MQIITGVNAKKIARSRNPAHPTRAEVKQAQELFRDFRGDDAASLQKVRLPNPGAGLVIGELDGVLYNTVRDGKREKYIHRFKARSRPLLVSSFDGSSLVIVGGHYRFTDAGIEDR